MRLLVDFLCRFGWGLSLGLVLTPAEVVPSGFFRVNLLVVLGVATFAALVGRGMTTGPRWLPAAAAVTAWLGSVLWLAERRSAGILACAACAVILSAAVVAVQPSSDVSGPVAATAATIVPLVSGLVVGLTVHAMLLGHWYLNAPGMRVDALRRMIDAALVAWGLQLAVTLSMAAASPAAAGRGPDSATVAIASLRWLAGLVGLPFLLWLSRKTLDIPNTQSATGILYVACIAAIVGELAAQLLQATG
ncbi:MAG: hypothetical protein EBZ59_04720 [Planctomycetia bacterium]|nr:hypothetical protein [Planctomycetia bacterium]